MRTAVKAMPCGVVCLVLSLTLAACSAADQSPTAAPDQVRAVVVPYLSTAPFYIAQTEGYCAAENLDVEFVRLARYVDAIPALVQGQVDVATGQISLPLLNAIGRGAHLRVVAGSGHLSPQVCTFDGIVVRRDLLRDGVTADAERLRGRPARVDLFLPQAYWLDTALAPIGLSVDDFEAVSVPPPAMVAGFVNGAFDVLDVAEPFLTRLLEASDDAVLWHRTEDGLPNYQQVGVFFGPSFLDGRPGVGERFMRALLRGMEQYNLGKTPRNLDIVEEATGLGCDELATMCWMAIEPDGSLHPEGFEGYQQWAVGRDLLDHVVPDSELIDRRFIRPAGET